MGLESEREWMASGTKRETKKQRERERKKEQGSEREWAGNAQQVGEKKKRGKIFATYQA